MPLCTSNNLPAQVQRTQIASGRESLQGSHKLRQMVHEHAYAASQHTTMCTCTLQGSGCGLQLAADASQLAGHHCQLYRVKSEPCAAAAASGRGAVAAMLHAGTGAGIRECTACRQAEPGAARPAEMLLGGTDSCLARLVGIMPELDGVVGLALPQPRAVAARAEDRGSHPSGRNR